MPATSEGHWAFLILLLSIPNVVTSLSPPPSNPSQVDTVNEDERTFHTIILITTGAHLLIAVIVACYTMHMNSALKVISQQLQIHDSSSQRGTSPRASSSSRNNNVAQANTHPPIKKVTQENTAATTTPQPGQATPQNKKMPLTVGSIKATTQNKKGTEGVSVQAVNGKISNLSVNGGGGKLGVQNGGFTFGYG